MDARFGNAGNHLRSSDIGTVVMRHAVSGVAEEGYSVEFFDMIGNTVVVTRSGRRTARSYTGRPSCHPDLEDMRDSDCSADSTDSEPIDLPQASDDLVRIGPR